MKKTLISVGASILLLTGCANNLNLGLNQNKNLKKETLRELIASKKENYHILADNNKKTLFTSYNVGVVGNSLSNVGVEDILRVRDMLKNYCEAKGGKWVDGKRYELIAKEDTFRGFTTIGKTYNNDYLGICKMPNGNGFKVKELGIYDYQTDWKINGNLGGGDRISWHNYYEIVYNKSNPPKKDYMYLTMPVLKKVFPNAEKLVSNYNNITNSGRDNYYLAQINSICRNFGGTAYIMSDMGTDMKKMKLNNYLFKMFDEEYDKYKDKKESFTHEYRLFPVKDKAYIWCQNTANPDNQFMLIFNPRTKTFNTIKGYKPSLLPTQNISEQTATLTQEAVKNASTPIIQKSQAPDRNAYNLARSIFMIRGDISVSDNPYVKYYGYYIGDLGNCEYAAVEKKEAGLDRFYNFKKCGGNIEYTGQTLKGLTQAEYNRFAPYMSGLKQSCETDGRALVQINGYNLYCRSNKNGGYKIFILNGKYQMIDKVK